MCGIVGVMSKGMSTSELSRFKDLYAVAQLRGDTGAGLVVVPERQKVDSVGIRRTTWSSGHLVTTNDFYDATKKSCSILVGHARAPTRGENTLKNVHPHRSGDIILVHNGTMTNVDNTQVTATQKHTDSAMIAECLAKHGPQHFVDKSSGAYALVWINLKDQTINFLRNGERTLWFCRENDSMIAGVLKTLWWASEASMMMFVLSRYTSYNKEKMKYLPLPVDEWWSFPLTVSKVIAEPTIRTCRKKYEYSTHSAWTGNNYPYSSWEHGYDDDQDPRHTYVTKPSSSPKLPVVVPLKQGTFQYTPPGEERPRFLTVAEVVEKRKSAAARATGTALHDERTKHSKRSLLDYCVKDDDEVERRLKAGPCVWCSETPTAMMPDMAPTIFAVKHTSARDEYVCSTCINDLDVQSFVGVK